MLVQLGSGVDIKVHFSTEGFFTQASLKPSLHHFFGGDRVRSVECGLFTPLVFSTFGGRQLSFVATLPI